MNLDNPISLDAPLLTDDQLDDASDAMQALFAEADAIMANPLYDDVTPDEDA